MAAPDGGARKTRCDHSTGSKSPDSRSGPRREEGAAAHDISTSSTVAPEPVGPQLRRRRNYPGTDPEMDGRTRPLHCGTFGLSRRELLAYARWLRANGWAAWEVAKRLERPVGDDD